MGMITMNKMAIFVNLKSTLDDYNAVETDHCDVFTPQNLLISYKQLLIELNTQMLQYLSNVDYNYTLRKTIWIGGVSIPYFLHSLQLRNSMVKYL